MLFRGISPDILSPYTQNVTKDNEKLELNFTNTSKDKIIDELLLDFNLFQTGAYIEQSKIFTGDPAMYKNSDAFFKRMSMINSTKKVSVVDDKNSEGLKIDKIYNKTNNFKILYKETKDSKTNDKILEGFTIKSTELKKLVKKFNDTGKWDLNAALTKKQKTKLTKLLKDSGSTIDSLKLVPNIGYNPDYILSGKKYDGSFDSMIMEDIWALSPLANDDLASLDDSLKELEKPPIRINNDGSVTYYTIIDNNGKPERKPTTPSALRKEFTESFIADGITDETKLAAKVEAYLSPYQNMEEADAQSYATMGMYKEILLRASDWSDQHQAAYNKVMMGEELSPKEMFLFRFVLLFLQPIMLL